jgi:hypothetical protein
MRRPSRHTTGRHPEHLSRMVWRSKMVPGCACVVLLLVIYRTRLFLHNHSTAPVDGFVFDSSQVERENNSPHLRDACPPDSTVMLVFPHVAKTGGRTLEATFMERQVRHRHVSPQPRSPRYNITLLNGHRDLVKLAKSLGCKSRLRHNDMRECET